MFAISSSGREMHLLSIVWQDAICKTKSLAARFDLKERDDETRGRATGLISMLFFCPIDGALSMRTHRDLLLGGSLGSAMGTSGEVVRG